MFDKIENGRWWDFGWQLIEGCTKCSTGCENCWSLAKEHRLNIPKEVTFKSDRLQRPLKRKKPTSYAIWNDLFHESVSFECINAVFSVMSDCDHHTYMLLTKRPQKALDFYSWKWEQIKLLSGDRDYIPWKPKNNVWIGVSVENQKAADERIPLLLQIPAAKRFVSCEPLLENIKIDEYFKCTLCGSYTYAECPGRRGSSCKHNNYIDWVIAGAETGIKKRPCKEEWIEYLYKQCKETNTKFFDKQDILGLNIRELPT